MKTAKVESVEVGRSWEKDNVTYYTHTYILSDGQKIQANHKKENPIAVGEEVEYEVKRTHEKYGDSGSVKKPNDFKKGTYKKPTLKLVDAKRMASSNAIHAVITVNVSYREERLKGDALSLFESFTLGDISGDIEKFSEEDSLFTSRLSALNNAALESGYKSFKTASDVLKRAKELYKYITRKQ